MKVKKTYEVILMGASAGGLDALSKVLPVLPAGFPLPILIVQHISPHSDNYLAAHLNRMAQIEVKEAEEKESLRAGVAYIAPPNYHLLLEEDNTLSLSTDEKVNYSRPSIDVLFESAAYAKGGNIIAVVITGANHDGSAGAKLIKSRGGYIIVEDPATAHVPVMPESVLKLITPDLITALAGIGPKLIELAGLQKQSP